MRHTQASLDAPGSLPGSAGSAQQSSASTVPSHLAFFKSILFTRMHTHSFVGLYVCHFICPFIRPSVPSSYPTTRPPTFSPARQAPPPPSLRLSLSRPARAPNKKVSGSHPGCPALHTRHLPGMYAHAPASPLSNQYDGRSPLPMFGPIGRKTMIGCHQSSTSRTSRLNGHNGELSTVTYLVGVNQVFGRILAEMSQRNDVCLHAKHYPSASYTSASVLSQSLRRGGNACALAKWHFLFSNSGAQA